jgi:thiol-disulfide isomerase/thioredoxin
MRLCGARDGNGDGDVSGIVSVLASASNDTAASFGDVVSPVVQRPNTVRPEETQQPEQSLYRRRNALVAAASIALAVTNYGWQTVRQPAADPSSPQNLPPVRLLATMQQQSAPMSVIGRNGKPSVVEFWAPWCQDCRRSAPVMEELRREYGDRVNFVMVNGDDWSTAAPYARAFGVDAVPHIAMVTAEGDVRTALIGPVPKRVLTADLDALLQQQGTLPYVMLDVFAGRPSERRLRFEQ